MAKNPFKVGDRVYVYMHGWGKVTNDADIVTVELDGIGPSLVFVKEDYRLVSFTEYDPIKGGLSHDREDYVVSGSIKQHKQKAEKELADTLNEIGKSAENASKAWRFIFGLHDIPVLKSAIEANLKAASEKAAAEKKQKQDREFINNLLDKNEIIEWDIEAEISENPFVESFESPVHKYTGRKTLTLHLNKKTENKDEQPDVHGDTHAKGCFNFGDIKFRVEGHDLLAKLGTIGRWEDDPQQDIIPAETAERNLKALKYIKKLLKDNYNVVDDFISVEELGDEVQVSLTFKKG